MSAENFRLGMLICAIFAACGLTFGLIDIGAALDNQAKAYRTLCELLREHWRPRP